MGIVSTLEKHISDSKSLPKVKAALTNHLRETKRHATEMKKALSALGGTHPVLKEGVSKLVNLVAGLGTSAASDTVVKNGIADFANEHFEIACYTSLIATATELGETQIATTCKGILKEEKAMAKTLEALLKEVNAFYLRTLEEDAEEPPKTPKGSRVATKRSKMASKSTRRKTTQD